MGQETRHQVSIFGAVFSPVSVRNFVSDQGLLHRFLKEAFRVYPPQGEGQGHPERLLFPADPVTEENLI